VKIEPAIASSIPPTGEGGHQTFHYAGHGFVKSEPAGPRLFVSPLGSRVTHVQPAAGGLVEVVKDALLDLQFTLLGRVLSMRRPSTNPLRSIFGGSLDSSHV
jgi:hypothetical protein